jgi:hypothetical protein
MPAREISSASANLAQSGLVFAIPLIAIGGIVAGLKRLRK